MGTSRHLARLVDVFIVLIGLGILLSLVIDLADGGLRAPTVLTAVASAAAAVVLTLLNARDMLGERTWTTRPLRLVLQVSVAYAPAVVLGVQWLPWTSVAAVCLLGLLPRRKALPLSVVGLVAQVVLFAAAGESLPRALFAGLSYAATTLLLYGLLRAVAISTELARARVELARTEVLRERLRMSRDLHDLLGRSLAAISLKTELALRHQRRGVAERVQAELEQVLALSHQAGVDLRALVSGYRALSLATELRTSVQLLRDAGVRCREEALEQELPALVDETAAWVVREAVTNVLKHSDASCCAISCRVRQDADGPALVLTVTNDGARVPVGARAGTGLVGLLERVRALGGAASADRGPEGSFTLSVRVPLDRHTTSSAPGAVADDGAQHLRRGIA